MFNCSKEVEVQVTKKIKKIIIWVSLKTLKEAFSR